LSSGKCGLQAPGWRLRTTSREFLHMAYEGLTGPNLAKMVIGLRTPDYGGRLPKMPETLDEANHKNPHYDGWARHSYNDYLTKAE